MYHIGLCYASVGVNDRAVTYFEGALERVTVDHSDFPKLAHEHAKACASKRGEGGFPFFLLCYCLGVGDACLMSS